MGTKSQVIINRSVASEALQRATENGNHEDPVVANQYYIDPVNGNDAWSGLQPTHTSDSKGPFKTYSRFQQLLGIFTSVTVVQPSVSSPNILFVNILNDLLPGDPITIINSFTNGTEVLITGQNKVLAANKKISAIQIENPDTNAPWEITASGVIWANFIGKMVQFTSGVATGNRAYVAADLGGGRAMLSEIVQDGSGGIAINGGLVMPPVTGNPAVNDKFEILDFTSAEVGQLFMCVDSSTGTTFSTPPAGLVLTRLHIGGAELVTPTTVGDVTFGLTDCIVDANIVANSLDENQSLYNVSHTNGTTINGNLNEIAGLYVQCACTLINGTYFQDFNTMFQGNLASNGIFCNGGNALIGPVAFFNTQDFMICSSNGSVVNSGDTFGFSAFFVSNGFNPFWGSGNDSNIFIGPNSCVQIAQLSSDTSYHPPTVTTVSPFPLFNLNPQFATPGSVQACAIDFATQLPDTSAPGVLRDGSLANMQTLASAGGFVTNTDATHQNANMSRPDCGAQMTWTAQHM